MDASLLNGSLLYYRFVLSLRSSCRLFADMAPDSRLYPRRSTSVDPEVRPSPHTTASVSDTGYAMQHSPGLIVS